MSIYGCAERLLNNRERSDKILEDIMKFICLGYLEERQWDEMPECDSLTEILRERTALMDECFAYDDELRRGGHFIGGEALQSVRHAATLRYRRGKVSVTDGPYAETKEQLGGFLILEARDLNHAIQLMSKHPGVRFGPFEIRPVDEDQCVGQTKSAA
jgi:hypothetical protein